MNMHAIEQTYVCLLADIADLTGYSEIRGSYEGLQWLLHEAHKLEKCFVRSLCDGNVDIGSLPKWLQRLGAGSEKDPVQLRYLRQLLLFGYKAKVQHTDEQTEACVKNYLDTNNHVGRFSESFSKQSPKLLNLVRRHVQSVLYKFRPETIVPGHGPGASTTPKDRWTIHPSTIEAVYPLSDYMYLYSNRDHIAEGPTEYTDILRAKLVSVPKDTRGPRLICVHPAEAIWFQQGCRRELERCITSHRVSSGPWPHGHIHFDDQSVNGRIALLSSKSRKYATLDMKEASDRLSDVLVQILFGRKYKYFGCSRAQMIDISCAGTYSGSEMSLNAYAPMGNATVFPVQSLVFWAICCASLQCRGFHQPGAVFVFGDDIIVPTECAEFVIDDLETFGLLVNKEKSFYRGMFRESCGVDAFNGINVTPLRWTSDYNAEHVLGLQSLSDLAMRLRIAGFENSSSSVYSIIRKRLASRGIRLSFTTNPDHGGIAEYVQHTSLAFHDAYWHRDSQQFVSPVWRLKCHTHRGVVSGWNHVLESVISLQRKTEGSYAEFTRRESDPYRREPRRVSLSRGWTPIP